MKTGLFIRIGILTLMLSWVESQVAAQQQVEVAYDKTTFLVFDAPIESVDRGSRMLMSQRDEAGKNLLKLKAGSRDLEYTNLHVLTADGKLHDFTVRYAADPVQLTVDLRTASSDPEKTAFLDLPFSVAEFESIHQGLNAAGRLVKSSAYQMEGSLTGIYFSKGILFFDLTLLNHSVIPFELDRIEVKISDKRSSRRSSFRTVSLVPAYSSVEKGHAFTGDVSESLMLAFPVFTIAENKVLEFSFYELHGDRQLPLQISGKKLLKADLLPISNLNQLNDGSGKF